MTKMQNCESNPEEKEHRWRHNPPRLQIILQSYSNQNSIGTKTDIWIKRIESPEINPHIDCQSLTKAVRIQNEEKTVSLASSVGKAG